MKGTLALWYEPTSSGPIDPPDRVRVELHLNLWRDLPSGANFLDIGMLFERPEAMRRFYLYVPALLARQQVHDLSGILRSTANAVFNDVVHFGVEADHQYEILRSGLTDTVFEIVQEDLELVPDGDAVFGAGTRLTFRDGLIARMKAATGRPYLRFRIRLTGDARNLFSSEVPARDQVFASSAGILEVTEFRLNERRSFPSSISNRREPGEFRITRIHYFLIRDLEHQLISQHAPFEKVRRMEAELWLKYLASAYPEGADRLTAKLAERLVIYHWKEREPKDKKEEEQKGVGDFIAFASFRTTSSNLHLYAVVIVLLGAAGSLLAAAATKIRARRLMPGDATGEPGASTLLAAELQLLMALACLILALVIWPAIRSWTRAAFSGVSKTVRRAKIRLALRKDQTRA